MPDEITLDEYRASIRRARTPRTTATEAQEQAALFQWIDTVSPIEPRLAWAFHVPNGEYRPKATAQRLRLMGVRPGVPDIWLPVPSRGYVGCVVELKADGGDTSVEQDAWLIALRAANWRAFAWYGWEAAARELCWYLQHEPKEFGL